MAVTRNQKPFLVIMTCEALSPLKSLIFENSDEHRRDRQGSTNTIHQKPARLPLSVQKYPVKSIVRHAHDGAADRPCRRRQRQIHPPDRRRDFFVYVDEVQSFITLALANMLSELRKYRVGFTIAHQYLQQLSPEIRHAVLDNIGTIISFRVGAEDAPYLAKEFEGEFDRMDLIRLANYRVYIKLMIDGTPSKPFSAITLRTI
jgi:hypothetical protein